MILTLRREAYLPDATLGILDVMGRKFPTLENRRVAPDRHDSCLPTGIYKLVPRQRASGEKAYAVVNIALGVYERPSDVPRHVTDARSACYVACGFTLDDLVGCHVAVGKGRSKRPEGWQLDASRDALNEVRTIIGNRLEIGLVIEG